MSGLRVQGLLKQRSLKGIVGLGLGLRDLSAVFRIPLTQGSYQDTSEFRVQGSFNQAIL